MLNIDIKVKLPSGTELVLTPQQRTDVAEYVTVLVNKGAQSVASTQPQRRRAKRYVNWNKEDADRVLDLFLKYAHLPDRTYSSERGREVRQLAKELGRVTTSVYSKYGEIKKKFDAKKLT